MKMILRWLGCLTLLGMLLVSLSGIAYAQPKLPHFFYGTVTINDSPALVDTVVTAKVGGAERGSYTTTQTGKYGNLATSDYLLVQGDIVEGATIKFYVNGVDTNQTATFLPGGGPTEVNLTATVLATIGYSPSSFSFTAIAGGANPSSQTLSISNSHVNPTAMVWSLSDDAAWLSLSPASGSSSGEVDSVTLSVSISGMSAGSYSATITISAPGATNTPRTVPVSLTISAPPPPAPAPAPPAVTTVSVPGFTATVPLQVNAQGIVQATTQLTTADGKTSINIASGTKLLDAQGNRLTSLSAAVMPTPPPPPAGANVIGLAYTFGPDGATFNPPLTLTWSYDPNTLPIGVAEEDLVIAYYNVSTGAWVELPCVVDAANNKITASVSHFTTFAIIGTVTLPPPPAPAPAAFSLSNLTIKPAEVQPGELVTITVTVTNTGGTGGSYTVVLKLNGVKEAEKSVTIALGSSDIVTFSVSKEEAGSYSVTIDSLSASFTVLAPAPPAPPTPPTPPTPPVTPPVTPEKVPVKLNWPLIGGIVGGAIVVGLAIFFLVRRRAQ